MNGTHLLTATTSLIFATLITGCTTSMAERRGQAGYQQQGGRYAAPPHQLQPQQQQPQQLQPQQPQQMSDRELQALRQRHARMAEEERTRRAENRLLEIESANNRLRQDLQQIQTQADTQARSDREGLRQQIAILEDRVASLERQLQQQRSAIMNETKDLILRAVNESRAAATPPRSRPQQQTPQRETFSDRPLIEYEYVVEHTVKSGETISQIAVRYGVPSAEIIRLNKLPNAGNSIRVGQILEIPDP